ncbi:unnamed protein product [Dicrocoelium dendriticum]|nr:unnamed protein product [Dicrocoelium dendriticum]
MALQCFISGISNEQARERLLSEDETTLSWEKACDIIRQLENVHKQLADFSSQSLTVTVQVIDLKICYPETVRIACYRCGTHHLSAEECPRKQSIYHQCGKLGHSARVCRSKACTAATSPFPKKPVKAVQTSDEEDQLSTIWNGTSGIYGIHPPYTVQLEIEGQLIKMEVDTGALVTVISASSVKKLPKLSPCESTLRTYTGQPMPVMGKCTVHVNYHGEKRTLQAYIMANDCANLLGCDWIKCLPVTLDNEVPA